MAGQRFLPESRYSRKTRLPPNWEKDPQQFVNEIVHVKPINFIPGIGLFAKGENFEGLISLKELTIYSDIVPSHLAGILIRNNFLVTAKIINYSAGIFMLSRKETMLDALPEVFDAMNSGKTILAKISNINGITTFLDIGAGICAILPIYEVSSAKLGEELLPQYFEGIDSIPVKILAQSKRVESKFIVSYKKTFSPVPLSIGDIVKGRIIRTLSDGSGKVVEISPVQAGVVDLGLQSWITLNIGQIYTFRVTRVRQKKNGTIHYSLELIYE